MDKAIETVKRTQRYEIEATPQDVLRHMAFLRDMDKEAEGKQALGLWIGIAGIVVSLGSLFFLPLSLVALIVGLPMAIGGFIYRSSWGKLNLIDRRYELVAKTVDAIRRDMADGASVQATIDFRSATDKSKFKEKGKVGVWDVSYYEDPWLKIRGRFMDGTAFLLELNEATQNRGRWKTSMSGKRKYKSKTKTATTASLRLKVKPHKYPGLQQFTNEIPSVAMIHASWNLKSANGTGDQLALKVATKDDWQVPAPGGKAATNNGAVVVSMLFLSLYRVLNMCKGQGAPQ